MVNAQKTRSGDPWPSKYANVSSLEASTKPYFKKDDNKSFENQAKLKVKY
jgi:hypothetical protein